MLQEYLITFLALQVSHDIAIMNCNTDFFKQMFFIFNYFLSYYSSKFPSAVVLP